LLFVSSGPVVWNSVPGGNWSTADAASDLGDRGSVRSNIQAGNKANKKMPHAIASPTLYLLHHRATSRTSVKLHINKEQEAIQLEAINAAIITFHY